MIAGVIFVSLWEASHCAERVTASTSVVRLEVVILEVPRLSCVTLPPAYNKTGHI